MGIKQIINDVVCYKYSITYYANESNEELVAGYIFTDSYYSAVEIMQQYIVPGGYAIQPIFMNEDNPELLPLEQVASRRN